MKIKTLAALCRKNKAFFLFDSVSEDGEVGTQWLGDGLAVYPLFNLPYLYEDTICTLFDIPDKQQEKIIFRHQPLPEGINFTDADAHEHITNPEKITIGYAGRVLRPIQTRKGLAFIDTAHLAPLDDIADTMELYERTTPSGGTYFAAKMGLLIAGVILPYNNALQKEFVEQLETISGKCRMAFDKAERARAEADAAADHEQMSI